MATLSVTRKTVKTSAATCGASRPTRRSARIKVGGMAECRKTFYGSGFTDENNPGVVWLHTDVEQTEAGRDAGLALAKREDRYEPGRFEVEAFAISTADYCDFLIAMYRKHCQRNGSVLLADIG